MDDLVEAAKNPGVRCFVDSGAFSEVDFTSEGPVWPAPMTPSGWRAVFRCYEIAAQAFGGRCYVVAPDRVADQAETLRRQERYRRHVRAIAAHGAQILVPVQKGSLPMADFYAAELVTLGLPADQVIPAVPMKKDATSVEDLVDFVRATQPTRLHLLGLGPKRRGPKGYDAVVAAVLAVCPGCEIMSDSVLMAAISGRGNGSKITGKRRALTVALDQIRMRRPDLGAQDARELAIRLLAAAARPSGAIAAAA